MRADDESDEHRVLKRHLGVCDFFERRAVSGDGHVNPDTATLMVLVYRLLPENEPRWRDTGTITHARFLDPAHGRVTLAQTLQFGRGDYIAHLRLSAFPTLALAEWLRYRHRDIRLRQPVMRLEFISRGWRDIERIDATREPRQMAEDLAALGSTARFKVGKLGLTRRPRRLGLLWRNSPLHTTVDVPSIFGFVP